MEDQPTISAGQDSAEERAGGMARADFLKVAALATGAVATGRILLAGSPSVASAARRSPHQDRDILNFLLLLEYLQAAFYKDAVNRGALHGDLARFAQVVAGHEKAHVIALRRKLGSHARRAPAFDFGNATSDPHRFAAAATKLEELAVGAFVGQGANLTRGAVLRVARIASVEGRHAAWVRDIQTHLPAPSAADAAIGQHAVASTLRALGFIKGGAS
ncbi:MAG TPA: ferritin-like domain-containing protein [Actinomycetota bacterium]|nr:ferritin-like domain-containing protein [Actinomycetota bacterium]